ncbi:MAG: hypothetical protein R2788_21985 [Saprospiraceae bacterium]
MSPTALIFMILTVATWAFLQPSFRPPAQYHPRGGLSISPNSTVSYIMSTDEVYQFDLWRTTWPQSRQTVAVWDGLLISFRQLFLPLQLGPDGRMYMNATERRPSACCT